MKKIKFLLATFTISLLQLQGCNEDRPDPGFDAEDMMKKEEFESVMDDNRLWKIGAMTSDIPRELEFVEFNMETFELDTIRSTSTDWLSQMHACENDNPIILHYLAHTNLYGVENPDNLHIRVEKGVGQACSEYEQPAVSHARAESIVKFEQYQARLAGAHDRFYGYTIETTRPEEDKVELWTNFKVSANEINYEVDKTYKGQVYHVKVSLVPLE